MKFKCEACNRPGRLLHVIGNGGEYFFCCFAHLSRWASDAAKAEEFDAIHRSLDAAA